MSAFRGSIQLSHGVFLLLFSVFPCLSGYDFLPALNDPYKLLVYSKRKAI